jgi:hypothetical protein
MNRKDVLSILVHHAKTNGFDFRRWFESKVAREWSGTENAIDELCYGRRYFALLFSHEFARSFWNQGMHISIVVPAATYTRRDSRGAVITVSRRAFTRRTLKPDAWRYHLREMAASDDPLRYISRFLVADGSLAATLPQKSR